MIARDSDRFTHLLGPYVQREDALDALRYFCLKNCLHFANILRLRTSAA